MGVKKQRKLLVKALLARGNVYLAAADLLREREDADVDAIHDFRVASRRLLVCEPLLRRYSKTGFWRRRVKLWLKSLNKVRDLQVMRETCEDDEELINLIDVQLASALETWDEHQGGIAGRKFRRRLRRSLSRFVSAGKNAPEVQLRLLTIEWSAAAEKLAKRFSLTEGRDLRALHKLRVSYKSFRYLAELMSDAGVLELEDRSKLKYWQDLLGSIHDLDVMTQWLTDYDSDSLVRAELKRNLEYRRQTFMAKRDEFEAFFTAVIGDR